MERRRLDRLQLCEANQTPAAADDEQRKLERHHLDRLQPLCINRGIMYQL